MPQVIAPSKYGIKETKEAVALGLSLMKAGSAFTQKKTTTAVAELMKAGGLVIPAVDNSKDIDDEARDLDASEIGELSKMVLAEVPNIAPEKAVKIVQTAIIIATAVAKGVIELKQ